MRHGSLSRRDLADVYRRGKRFNASIFTAYYLPGEGALETGIVASAKVGSAVQRNRAKRLLRAALERLEKKERKGAKIILSAKKEILGHKEAEVRAGIEKALAQFF